jgi:hypothetical protein
LIQKVLFFELKDGIKVVKLTNPMKRKNMKIGDNQPKSFQRHMEAEMNPITPDAEAIFIELGKLDSHS